MAVIQAFASANKTFPKFDDIRKRAQRGRKVYETPRKNTASRLQGDLSKIAKDELEFSKSILKHIIPVEVSIDKDATGIKKLIPLNINLVLDGDGDGDGNGNGDEGKNKKVNVNWERDSSSDSDAFLVDVE